MSEMNQLISEFPNNFLEAKEIALKANFQQPKNEIHNIVICGMGGSGIGGSLVAKWLENELSVSVTVVKDYSLPAFISKNSLVIGSSYSGNTEETISAVEEAVAKGAHIIGITSGGKMLELCESKAFDVVVVPGGNPPRTALAFSIVQLVNIFIQLGMADSKRMDEMMAGQQLIVKEEVGIKAEARKLAEYLTGKVGIWYGTSDYEPVLVRARQQFNENGKALGWSHSIPEMNHNELVGWGGGDERFAAVFIDTKGNHTRNDKRIEITKSKIEAYSTVHSIQAKGESQIEQSIYIINIVDWASLYLAEMENTDPIDITVIDFLKSELSKF